MGTDTSSMKDSTMISENEPNVHMPNQEVLNHTHRSFEQNQTNDKTENIQDVKVEKHYH